MSHITFRPGHTVRVDKGITENVLECIGQTPLIRINTITKNDGVKCNVFAKCEYYNAGGSVKDRIGKRMVEDAEACGKIKPGDTLIEPTSGNTGIGLALAGAIKGYRVIITMPMKMSLEKINVLKALGAEIIRTPNEAAFDSPDSHIGVAHKLNKEIPNSHILDQYTASGNPMAHYEGTGEEIWEQTGGKVDYLVAGAGTGGTISGIAKKLKEKNPNIIIHGIDPYGSILAQPESLNARMEGYQIEGIGYDFIPNVLDRSIVDQWVKSEDKPGFIMARRLIREEGLFTGGSSGTAMHAAIELAKTLPADANVVVVLADSVRNYMSKFLSDDWMCEYGFADDLMALRMGHWWSKRAVRDLAPQSPITVGPELTITEAINLMASQNFDMVPVQDQGSGTVMGVITAGQLTSLIAQGKVAGTDAVAKAMYKEFKKVNLSSSLADLSIIFDKDHYALVITEQKCYDKDGAVNTRMVVSGIVTRIDLLGFISKGE